MRTEDGGQMAEKIETYRDLRVYQLTFRLQQLIFDLTKTFPAEEKFSLSDQIRRSSRSIGANIAEAWHKRRYQAHFVSKLTDADGEQAETLHWIQTAFECGYLDAVKYDNIKTSYHEVGAMLGKMMSMPETFCKQYLNK
jgi:four helix bundle protein